MRWKIAIGGSSVRIAKLLVGGGSWPTPFMLHTTWKRAHEGGLDHLREWAKSVARPTLIIVDTLEKFRPPARNGQQSYSADYEALTGLQSITKEFPGLAIIVVHHDRKMAADDPFDTVSGTQGLTGAADTILIIKRDNGAVKLFVRGRDVEESETPIRFEKSSCKWAMLNSTDAESAISNERQAILDEVEGLSRRRERKGRDVGGRAYSRYRAMIAILAEPVPGGHYGRNRQATEIISRSIPASSRSARFR